jgi:CheY-like chemotaxis protein
VEQLSGQLRAESEVGVGTRFFFTLPMLVHRDQQSVEEKSPTGSAVMAAPNRQSSGSGSIESFRSGSVASSQAAHSEIDTFVHDFASSHMLAPVSADDKRLREAEERMSRPGTFPVTDSSFPVRPTKMDDQAEQNSPPPAAWPSQIASSPHQRPSHQFSRGMSYQMNQDVKQISDRAHKRRPSHPNTTPAKQPERTQRTEKTLLRTLVVEDDPINSQILQKRLRMDKHIAIPVTNGQEAVDFLQDDRDIDVVLMDIQSVPLLELQCFAD